MPSFSRPWSAPTPIPIILMPSPLSPVGRESACLKCSLEKTAKLQAYTLTENPYNTFFKGTHTVLYNQVYLKKSIQHSLMSRKSCVTIFYLGVLISPFSISTGKTSIFSTLFSSSYSADAETGSTSSLRRSYSSLEKVLKTCGDQRHSFSTSLCP